MILSKLDMFCWKKPMGSSAGTVYTDALDFGTGGNADLEPSGVVFKTAGHHGDDVLRALSFSLWVAVAAADTSLTVTWETSDNEPTAGTANSDASKADLRTWSLTAAQLAKGEFPIKAEALPNGLKRYNRLKITTTAGSDTDVATKVFPTLSAFIHDGRDA